MYIAGIAAVTSGEVARARIRYTVAVKGTYVFFSFFLSSARLVTLAAEKYAFVYHSFIVISHRSYPRAFDMRKMTNKLEKSSCFLRDARSDT